MDKQRIEVVGLRGIPGLMGGVEAHCEELIPRLAALAPDLDFEVIARRPYAGTGEINFRGVQVKPLPAPRKASLEAIVSTFLGVIQAKRRGALLIHFHGIGPAILVPLARLLGMRVLLTHHSLNYDHRKWGGFARFMLRLGERFGVRYADGVIAVAPWLANRLRRQFPAQASKVVVIPNGRATFPNRADDGILEELGLASGGYVLGVGRLVPEKAFDVLIDAMERSGNALKLVLVGGADHESHFSRGLMARATPRIVFAGVRQRAALKALYANAAVFVLPSTHEGMPMAALEAASFGCPVLLSDIEPNRDLGLPKQHYFVSGDVDALANKLSRSFQQLTVDRDRFASFDWDHIAKSTLSVYRAILEKAGRRLSNQE
jgi:glycosyltransferase involved in cell wall biosynthesis